MNMFDQRLNTDTNTAINNNGCCTSLIHLWNMLTSLSGLWGSMRVTTCPFLTSIAWESPSQATVSSWPQIRAATPVVPLRRRCQTHKHTPTATVCMYIQYEVKAVCYGCFHTSLLALTLNISSVCLKAVFKAVAASVCRLSWWLKATWRCVAA